LARSGDQFRQSDVTFWGIAAICCGGLALLSITLAALVPANVLSGLHASRLEGATTNQLRTQVAGLQTAIGELARENETLLTRFDLAQQENGDVAQRVGAIEVAIPNLVEQNGGEGIDTSAVTASIGPQTSVTTEVEGGELTIQQGPLVPVQPMPRVAVAAPPRADGDSYGVAIGIATDAYSAPAAWGAMQMKVGTLLIGLSPVLADDSDGIGKYLVAGPLAGFAEARDLCARLAPVGIPCRPAPFAGTPLAP
jgi:hypothetical protein